MGRYRNAEHRFKQIYSPLALPFYPIISNGKEKDFLSTTCEIT